MSGQKNSETVGAVTLSSANGFAASLTKDAGTYTGEIVASAPTGGTLNQANYLTPTFVAGTLTVDKAPLTITADARSKTYGEALSLGTTAFTTSGLKNAQTITAVTLSSVHGDDSSLTVGAGAYASEVVASNQVGANGFAVGNYNITFTPATLTVNPRLVSVTADDKARFVGQANPLFTYVLTSGSLVNGDTFSGTLGTLAGVSSPAAKYDITRSTLTLGANYTITYLPGILTVSGVPANDPVRQVVAGSQRSFIDVDVPELLLSRVPTTGRDWDETYGHRREPTETHDNIVPSAKSLRLDRLDLQLQPLNLPTGLTTASTQP